MRFLVEALENASTCAERRPPTMPGPPMRPSLPLFLVLAVTACSRPPAPGPAGTTFAEAAPAPGDRRTTKAELALNGRTAAGSDVTVRERSKRTEEVLAVDRGVVTRKRVTREVDGAPAEVSVVEGPDAPDPVAAAVPDAPLAPGQAVDPLARAIAGRMKGLTVTGASAIFVEAKGEDGVFDVAMRLAKTEGATPMTMDLHGRLHVSTRTRAPTAMHLEGPVAFGGGTGTVTFDLEEK